MLRKLYKKIVQKQKCKYVGYQIFPLKLEIPLYFKWLTDIGLNLELATMSAGGWIKHKKENDCYQ